MLHERKITVRFSETDAAGHVNNTSYFIYMEEARGKFFEALGFGRDPSDTDMRFILASTKCDFVDQAYFNDELKVTTAVSKIGEKSFRLQHEIVDEESARLIARGEAVIVHFNYHSQQSEELPESVKTALESCLVTSL